jgi:hypothetical protein
LFGRLLANDLEKNGKNFTKIVYKKCKPLNLLKFLFCKIKLEIISKSYKSPKENWNEIKDVEYLNVIELRYLNTTNDYNCK